MSLWITEIELGKMNEKGNDLEKFLFDSSKLSRYQIHIIKCFFT